MYKRQQRLKVLPANPSKLNKRLEHCKLPALIVVSKQAGPTLSRRTQADWQLMPILRMKFRHTITWEPPTELNQAACPVVPIAAHDAGLCRCIHRGLTPHIMHTGQLPASSFALPRLAYYLQQSCMQYRVYSIPHILRDMVPKHIFGLWPRQKYQVSLSNWSLATLQGKCDVGLYKGSQRVSKWLLVMPSCKHFKKISAERRTPFVQDIGASVDELTLLRLAGVQNHLLAQDVSVYIEFCVQVLDMVSDIGERTESSVHLLVSEHHQHDLMLNCCHKSLFSSSSNTGSMHGKLYLLVQFSCLGGVLICPKLLSSLRVDVLLLLDKSSNTLQLYRSYASIDLPWQLPIPPEGQPKNDRCAKFACTKTELLREQRLASG